jgi:hypothetical protein
VTVDQKTGAVERVSTICSLKSSWRSGSLISSVKKTGGIKFPVLNAILAEAVRVRVCTVIIAESYFFFDEHSLQRQRITSKMARKPMTLPTTIIVMGTDSGGSNSVEESVKERVGFAVEIGRKTIKIMRE